MGWAVGRYLASMNGSDEQANDIDTLLSIKEARKVTKTALFDSGMVNKMRTNMAKRSLFLSSMGKRRIWRPQRYIPSRQVVLANSIEELNNLYSVEGTKG